MGEIDIGLANLARTYAPVSNECFKHTFRTYIEEVNERITIDVKKDELWLYYKDKLTKKKAQNLIEFFKTQTMEDRLEFPKIMK